MVRNYVRMARVDHWFKNVFMLPGTALAILFTDIPFKEAIWPTLLGISSTCLVASANYVINEWLDAESDKHHPLKKHRPSIAGGVKKQFVYLEYLLLVAAGLGLAALLPKEFFMFSAILLIMGILYNVKPFRTKDISYLDVLTESVNNPLRLLLGWSAIVTGAFPPSSILLAYWMGGAFLMAVKRFSEYRFIGDPERAGLYRKSFQAYTEETLLLSSFFYALSSAFFLGIFLIKYRIEFLLSFPLFALLFVWYLAIGMKPRSPAQRPEHLYREVYFMGYVILLGVCVTLLFVVDIPWLTVFVEGVRY